MRTNKNLMHIHKSELSSKIQSAIDRYGFSIYKGVLIVWSDVRDEFLLEMIDDIVPRYPDQLLIVHFEDYLLEMIWKNEIPDDFTGRVREFENIRMELDSSSWKIPVIYNKK